MVEKYVCGYVFFFEDGGEAEVIGLHRGTMEECEKIGAACREVTYDGPRTAVQGMFVIAEAIEERVSLH